MLAQELRRQGRVHLRRRPLGGRHRSTSCASWRREDPRVRILENPRRSTPVALNIGLARRPRANSWRAWTPTRTTRPTTWRAGVERLRRGGAEHVSGPQLPHGEGTWSRRVALALAAGWAPAGRTSATSPAARSRWTAASPACGPRRRSSATAAGTRAGPTTRTPSWRRASEAPAGAWCACRRWRREYIPRDSLRKLARQYWRYGLYRAKTSGRHPESMRRSHVLAPGLVATLAVAPARARAACAARRGPGLALYAARASLAVSASEARPAAGGSTPPLCRSVFADHAPLLGARLPGRVACASAPRSRRSRGWRGGRVSGKRPAAAAAGHLQRRLVPPRRGRGLRRPRAGASSSAGIARHVAERTILLGQLDPRPAAAALPRRGPDRVRAAPLLPEPAQPAALPAMARSVARFWRVLDDVDAVWLLGPHPLCLVFALLAALRRRSGVAWACARTSPSTCAAATRDAGRARGGRSARGRLPAARAALSRRSWWGRSSRATTRAPAVCSRSTSRSCASPSWPTPREATAGAPGTASWSCSRVGRLETEKNPLHAGRRAGAARSPLAPHRSAARGRSRMSCASGCASSASRTARGCRATCPSTAG